MTPAVSEWQEALTWFNTELVRAWPVLVVLGGWLAVKGKRAAGSFVRGVVADITARQDHTAGVVNEVREQVQNSHTTNLRHDLDAIHEDVRAVVRLNEAHLDWSREWTERVERTVDEHGMAIVDLVARVSALEAVAATPTPPA